MEYENLLVSIDGKVATITINRPAKANALNADVMMDLESAFTKLGENNEVRVVILTGFGDKFFVAGADIKEIATLNATTGAYFAKKGQGILSVIENLGKPVIAAVNGFALGGGCELALACTIRIASKNAKFGLPELGLGVIPGFGGTQRLSRIIGKGRSFEYMLTGDMIAADEAYIMGLANKVVEQENLMKTAVTMAQKMCANAPLAIKYCLEAVNSGLNVGLEEGLKLESDLFGLTCATGDMKIGMQAFIDKKDKPDFKGE